MRSARSFEAVIGTYEYYGRRAVALEACEQPLATPRESTAVTAT